MRVPVLPSDRRNRGSISVSIFIKSWHRDLRWLGCALQSIYQHWKEPETEIVVVVDQDCEGLLFGPEFRLPKGCEIPGKVLYVRPWTDGYCHAMYIKTMADEFCRGDYILLTDSDCLLTQDSDLRDLTTKGPRRFIPRQMPIIPYLGYDDHHQEYPFSPWKKVTERLVCQPTYRHYMGRVPILYRRETFAAMRQYLSRLHGRAYWDLVYSGVPFDPITFLSHPITLMDYDLLGYYADHFEHDRYAIVDRKRLRPNKWKQFHSWTQTPEEVFGSGVRGPDICSIDVSQQLSAEQRHEP
jgi:hypothetical protein